MLVSFYETSGEFIETFLSKSVPKIGDTVTLNGGLECQVIRRHFFYAREGVTLTDTEKCLGVNVYLKRAVGRT